MCNSPAKVTFFVTRNVQLVAASGRNDSGIGQVTKIVAYDEKRHRQLIGKSCKYCALILIIIIKMLAHKKGMNIACLQVSCLLNI